MSNYPISADKIDELTLPLGKALSVLELFVDDLPCDQSNGGYVAQDLIREALTIIRSFDATYSAEDPDEKEKERLEAAVKTYFDPATDDAKRAQLEESISDEDFATELHTIKYQEKAFTGMVKHTEDRLQRFNQLKAKREQMACDEIMGKEASA